MTGDKIYYRDGYLYQLARTYQVQIDIFPKVDVITEYILLGTTGLLTIMEGYAWDGATHCPDTPDIMRGSLAHDALYQLMRGGQLDEAVYREAADRLLKQLCTEDGMCHPEAELVYQAVRIFGSPSADPANDKPVIEAP